MEISVEFAMAFLLLVLPSVAVAAYRYGRRVVPTLREEFTTFVQANLPPYAVDLLEQGAAMAVRAAEQAHLKENLIGKGEEKLAYALDILQTFLNDAGLGAINVKILEAAIRAALNQELEKPAEVQFVDLPFA